MIFFDGIHLTSQNIDKLHEFAQSIGLKREWYQDKTLPHYDIISKRISKLAVDKGAILTNNREMFKLHQYWKRRKNMKSLDINYNYKFIEEEPDKLEGDIIYIRANFALVMICPCGCGEKLYMNLNKASLNAKWDFKIEDKITIIPSINRTVGCKSHFWVKNGKVEWC